MVKALLDPAVLVGSGETNEEVRAWVTRLGRWSNFLREAPVRPLLAGPTYLILAKSGSNDFETIREMLVSAQSDLGPADVLQLLNTITRNTERLADGLSPSEVIFEAFTLDPEYCAELDRSEIEAFRDDVAHLAASSSFARSQCGVVTHPSSWESLETAVRVVGQVALWAHPDWEDAIEPSDGIDADLPLWTDPEELDEIFCGDWSKLISHPDFAVRLAYRTCTLPGERGAHPLLPYRLGQRFESSMMSLGYGTSGNSGRAHAVFHAIAMVASGRTTELQSLQAHLHRSGPSGSSPPVRRQNGDRLLRGYLALNSPNAHRLFWWEGDPVEFVGVAGHDSAPPL
jgi:hypothetical protein